jgi:hypothetical protein
MRSVHRILIALSRVDRVLIGRLVQIVIHKGMSTTADDRTFCPAVRLRSRTFKKKKESMEPKEPHEEDETFMCDLLSAAGPQTADVASLPDARVAIDRHHSIGVNHVDGERTSGSRRFEFVRFAG